MAINQRLTAIGILAFGILLSLFLVWDALAASSADIKFPVVELNGCKNEAECRAFCDKPENAKPCLGFARKYNLLPEDELRKAEKLAEVKNGPGGCNSQKSCESFCNDTGNMDECLLFAEKNGLMDQGQLEEAKKVQGALKRGVKLPGGCSDKNSCDNYCGNPDNVDECLAFAEDAGIISQEELREAKKILPLLKRGEAPGACKSKSACEAYCEDESHADECISFAEKAGFISKEEAEIVKKTGGRGPGGCRGRACKAFCEDPANQDACFEFAKENGLIKEEDLQRMTQGRDLIRRDLEKAPPEIKSCIEEVLGPGGLDKLESGKPFGGRDIGEKMKSCFEKSIPSGFGQFKESGEFSGPGGCRSFEECSSYCQANPEECKGFKPPPGFEGGVPSGGFQQGYEGGMPSGTAGELFGESYSGPTYSLDFGLKCDFGWDVAVNNNKKYCAITQGKCDELHPGTVLTNDQSGFKVCWLKRTETSSGGPMKRIPRVEDFTPPVGNYPVPEGFKPPEGFAPPSGGYPSPEDLQKYQQQFQQQFQQQIPPEYQQQFQQQIPSEYQQYLPR